MSIARLPDGGRIAFDIAGHDDSPPILLVRPLGGWRASWRSFSFALARELRVIAFDARGTGESTAARWTTTRVMARDARALLDVLGIGRAHVYGISLGGMVASWLAIDAAERVDRLVLASSVAFGRAFRREAVHALGMARCWVRSLDAMEACLAEHTLSAEFRRDQPARVEAIRASASQRPATRRFTASGVAAVLRHDVRLRIHDITAQTLVLAGTRDALLPADEQRRFALRLPHGSFDTIDAGHDISSEAPEECAARVIAHVARA